jgi:adenylate kinase family enzyme
MDPENPQTWDNLATHPAFQTGTFDPNWYDGNVKEDLMRLRNATNAILDSFPRWAAELVVLDDCTMYVCLKDGDSTVASLYPSKMIDDKPCYFLDIERRTEEFRVATIEAVVALLRDAVR